jgi:hypothetical protein
MKKYNEQKTAIDYMTKSEGVSLTELATLLEKEPASLGRTLSRNTLLLNQFCKIFKYIYKKEYDCGNPSLNLLRNIDELKLTYFIDALRHDNRKLIVTLYKNTNIQLVNK